jgi:mono/diheme cytochrome c family protein
VKLFNGKGVCFIDNRFPLNKINSINVPMHPKKTSLKLAVAALSALFSLIAVGSAKDPKPAATLPPASTQTGVTYAKDMKPIFEVSCVKCHQGDKPKARLKMDTLEGVLKGTKHGAIVIPGNSAKSMLVESVAYLGSDSESWMPPVHNKAGIKQLTPEQIGLIRAWIDQGAK